MRLSTEETANEDIDRKATFLVVAKLHEERGALILGQPLVLSEAPAEDTRTCSRQMIRTQARYRNAYRLRPPRQPRSSGNTLTTDPLRPAHNPDKHHQRWPRRAEGSAHSGVATDDLMPASFRPRLS